MMDEVAAKVQAGSGLTFALFLAPHLCNTIAGVAGEAAYDGLQTILRSAYQNPAVEAVVIGSAVVHLAATAVRKVIAIRSSPSSKPAVLKPTLHCWSGYVIAALIGGHVFFCRFQGVAPHFAGLSWIQSVPRIGNLFTAYLIVFASAGCAHLAIGVPKAWKTLDGSARVGYLVPRRRTVWAFCALLAAGVVGIRGGAFATGSRYSNSPYARAHANFA